MDKYIITSQDDFHYMSQLLDTLGYTWPGGDALTDEDSIAYWFVQRAGFWVILFVTEDGDVIWEDYDDVRALVSETPSGVTLHRVEDMRALSDDLLTDNTAHW